MKDPVKLLTLRITDRCNLACKYCYAESGTGQDMSFEIAKRAISLLASSGEKLKIQFTGGEPLLCLDLMVKIAEHLEKEQIKTGFSIQTNGTLLTGETCAVLKKMRCAVGVSLDGMGAANGARVYPNGEPAFDDIVKGIGTLAAAGIQCNLNAVISRMNQAHLDELADLAAYLPNVRGIGLDMFRPIGRGRGCDLEVDLATLEGDFTRLLARYEKLCTLGANLKIKELEKIRSMLNTNAFPECYCYAQTEYSVAVDPKGDIYPCSSMIGMRSMFMGNVEDGIMTSVNVPGMDEICVSCAHAEFCRGGCPAGRVACGGCNPGDCIMHRMVIDYGRKKNA